MPNMIKIWPWVYAPKKYKKLGSGKNWLAYVPGEYLEGFENEGSFAMLVPNKYCLESGDYVFIG